MLSCDELSYLTADFNLMISLLKMNLDRAIYLISLYRSSAHRIFAGKGAESDQAHLSTCALAERNNSFFSITRVLFASLVIMLSHVSTSEAAQKVLVLQSMRIAPFEETIKGMRSVVTCSVKQMVLSELEGVDIIRMVRSERPDVILAIGADALTRVRKIRDTPIVYLMVFDPQYTLTAGSNITGIGMHASPERQLAALHDALPGIKRVGFLYSTRQNHLVRRLQSAAKSHGVELIAREVHSSREVPKLIEGMKGNIEAFLLFPDAAVITQETVEYLLVFSFSFRIPIMTFSSKYADMGALMALDVNLYDLGRQSGDMVNRILSGIPPAKITHSDPQSTTLTVNLKTARKLGLKLTSESLERAQVIR